MLHIFQFGEIQSFSSNDVDWIRDTVRYSDQEIYQCLGQTLAPVILVKEMDTDVNTHTIVEFDQSTFCKNWYITVTSPCYWFFLLSIKLIYLDILLSFFRTHYKDDMMPI